MSTVPVFLPGWGLGRQPLQATVDALGGCILDLPGYGNAAPIADFDAAVDAIAARLAPASLLAGWSLGALLALAVAARHPDKVARLLLVAATPSFARRDGWPDAMPPDELATFAAAIAADPAAMLPRFVGGFNRGDRRAKAVTLELLRQADPLPATEVLLTGLDWLRDVDLRAELGQVRAPTCLVHGAADPLMPLAAARAMQAALPDARLVALDDCAHAPFISRPDAFLAGVREFLHA